MSYSAARVAGLIALVILVLALAIDFNRWMFAGLFTADYYYLPLREYVPATKVEAMEELVIDLYQKQSRHLAVFDAVTHAIALVAVAMLFNQVGVLRRTQQQPARSDSPDSSPRPMPRSE